MNLRLARPEEREALEALQMTASLADEAYRQALLDNPEAVHLPMEQIEAGQVVLAEDESGLLGFCVVLPREDGQAELDGLFTRPDAWGRGVGRALTQDALHRAAAMGAVTLHVIASPEARGFYERLGFEFISDTPTLFGPAISMARSVSISS